MSDEPPPIAQEKIWQCTNHKCGVVLREQELKHMIMNRVQVAVCPHCGRLAVDVTPEPPPVPKETTVTDFFASVALAFVYPFTGAGPFVLAIGAIIIGLARIGAIFPILGFIALALTHGYLFAYLFDIVKTTANGEDTAPDWPEFSDLWDTFLRPFFLFLGTVLFSFAPAAAAFVGGLWLMKISTVASAVCVFLAFPLGLAGLVYFPMALLAVAIFDGISGVNPAVVLPSIGRVIGPYLLICVLLAAGIAAQIFLQLALGLMLPLAVSYFVAQFIGLYLDMVDMRLLGILFRAHEKELRWF